MMKDIITICKKTIVKMKDNIKDTETHLENMTEIQNSKVNTKRPLQQRQLQLNNLNKNIKQVFENHI